MRFLVACVLGLSSIGCAAELSETSTTDSRVEDRTGASSLGLACDCRRGASVTDLSTGETCWRVSCSGTACVDYTECATDTYFATGAEA